MILKLTGMNKANDVMVKLNNVPFDASRYDVVVSALKTLGNSDEVFFV